MSDNLLLKSDAYKYTHWMQLPEKTQRVYSYAESRGGRFTTVLFFGLQIFLKRYLEGPVVTKEKINEAEYEILDVFGQKYFNRKGWEQILNKHGGHLPLVIRAIPEGLVVPTNNILLDIENTDDEVPWLTQFVETPLLRGIW